MKFAFSLPKLIVIVLFFISACDEDPVQMKGYDFSDSVGVFIVNEGNYQRDNSTISFLNLESQRIYNDIFYAANEAVLGDVACSMVMNGNKGYIVINNSGRIYSIDARNARFKGKITGLTSPRYIHIVNENKGYVTDMYSMKISVFDPEEFVLTGEIDVNIHSPFNQHSTEQMAGYGKYVFISCWSYDNKILVLDTTSDMVMDSITVPKQPNSIVVDKNNKLWVLSDGGYDGSAYGEEIAALSKIDAESMVIEKIMEFPSLDDSPFDLVLNGTADTLYFIHNGIFRMGITDTELPAGPLILPRNWGYYSLSIDPETSVIYAGDPLDYQQNGLIYRFTPKGELIDSFRTGINPGAFCFKR